MTSSALRLLVLAILGSVLASCSLPSFDEREASRESETDTTESGGDAAAPAATNPGGPAILGEPDPTADLADPDWVGLDLIGVPIATFESAVSLVARSGTDDLYVAERGGVVRRIERRFNDDGVERIATDTAIVLDISEEVTVDAERGLLDIVFSLDGRFLYVSYTDLSGESVISEYDIARSLTADTGSRRELLRVPQPFGNHNGGNLEIGTDGFLYIGLGDGGSSGDPDGNGQNANTLLGSILRIDPVAFEDQAYLIPDGNPFTADEGAPEVFLYGVRNPWRFSFDSLTGDLWIADVGQNRFEEINVLDAATGAGRGANLGWAEMEAFEPFDGGTEPPDHVRPIYAYPHEDGRCSITGGQVYRGADIPALTGVYLFGDYCSGELFGLERTDQGPMVRPLTFSLPSQQLVSIGTSNGGDVYVVLVGGEILRIEGAPTS